MKKTVFFILTFGMLAVQLPAEPVKVGGASAEAVQSAKTRQRLTWALAFCSVLVAAAGLTYLGLNHHHHHAH